jgi:hypothetical protein
MVSRDRYRVGPHLMGVRRESFFVEQGWTKARFVEPFQQIYPTGKSLRFIGSHVKPLAKKYFCLSEAKIRLYDLPSRPIQRGVAQGHQCGAGMRWTRMALLTRALDVDGEIVWFRHPQAGVKFAA